MYISWFNFRKRSKYIIRTNHENQKYIINLKNVCYVELTDKKTLILHYPNFTREMFFTFEDQALHVFNVIFEKMDSWK